MKSRCDKVESSSCPMCNHTERSAEEIRRERGRRPCNHGSKTCSLPQNAPRRLRRTNSSNAQSSGREPTPAMRNAAERFLSERKKGEVRIEQNGKATGGFDRDPRQASPLAYRALPWELPAHRKRALCSLGEVVLDLLTKSSGSVVHSVPQRLTAQIVSFPSRSPFERVRSSAHRTLRDRRWRASRTTAPD